MQAKRKVVIVGKSNEEIVQGLKSISIIEDDGSEIVILDDRDCDFLPLSETPIPIIPFHPTVEAHCFIEKKTKKGHERPYKYHR